MKFWEALKALEEGKQVRCKNWGPQGFWSFKKSGAMWVTLQEVLNLTANEWELYEEPEKTLTFSAVVKGLKEGKKFKRASWETGEISTDYMVCLELEDFEATDWTEVK